MPRQTEERPTEQPNHIIHTGLEQFKADYEAMIERYKKPMEPILDVVPHVSITGWFPEKGYGFAKIVVLPEDSPADLKVGDELFTHYSAIEGYKRGEDLKGQRLILDTSQVDIHSIQLNRQKGKYQISHARTISVWQAEQGELELVAKFRDWLISAITERVGPGRQSVTFSGDKQTLEQFGTPQASVGDGITVNDSVIPILDTDHIWSRVKLHYELQVNEAETIMSLLQSQTKTEKSGGVSIERIIELHKEAERTIRNNRLELNAVYQDDSGRQLVFLKPLSLEDEDVPFEGKAYAVLVDVNTGDIVHRVTGRWSNGPGDTGAGFGYEGDHGPGRVEYEFNIPDELNLHVANLASWGSELNIRNAYASTVTELLHLVQTNSQNQYSVETALERESYALKQVTNNGKLPASSYRDMIYSLSKEVDHKLFRELLKADTVEVTGQQGVFLEIARWQVRHGLVSAQEADRGVLYGLQVERDETGGYSLVLGGEAPLVKEGYDTFFKPFGDRFSVSIEPPVPNFVTGYFELRITPVSSNRDLSAAHFPKYLRVPIGDLKAPRLQVPLQIEVHGYKKGRRNIPNIFVLTDRTNNQVVAYYNEGNGCWLPEVPGGYERDDDIKITDPRPLMMLSFQSSQPLGV